MFGFTRALRAPFAARVPCAPLRSLLMRRLTCPDPRVSAMGSDDGDYWLTDDDDEDEDEDDESRCRHASFVVIDSAALLSLACLASLRERSIGPVIFHVLFFFCLTH